jgi:preprotein translocase subunit SecF
MSKPSTQKAGPIPASLKDGPLDVFKYRWLFLGISLLFLLPGLFFIGKNIMDPEIQAPVRLGIDFRGGTMLEYGFSKPVVQADVNNIRTVFDQHAYTGTVIQIQEPRVGINKQAVEIGATSSPTAPQPEATPVQPAPNNQAKPVLPNAAKKAELPSAQGSQQTPAPASPVIGQPAVAPVSSGVANSVVPPITRSNAVVQTPLASNAANPPAMTATGENAKIVTIVSIRSKQIQGQDELTMRQELASRYGHITLLQKNSIGPALAKELLANGLLALLMAYILIVGYLTIRFQFDFAVCAMAALIHDTVFLIGMFAMFGALFHTEVDSLFITAVLTVVGFSVHDTIVVFDRIRENNRLYFTKKVPFIKIVNMSINQTMARSINTSLTALLTMLALYLFGGETTKDFVLAIIIGIAAGTYSSIFNASVLLAMWRNRGVTVQVSSTTPATA